MNPFPEHRVSSNFPETGPSYPRLPPAYQDVKDRELSGGPNASQNGVSDGDRPQNLQLQVQIQQPTKVQPKWEPNVSKNIDYIYNKAN